MKTWNPGMTDKETADLAYWERNMLALYLADGWYNDDVEHFSGGQLPRYPGELFRLETQFGPVFVTFSRECIHDETRNYTEV